MEWAISVDSDFSCPWRYVTRGSMPSKWERTVCHSNLSESLSFHLLNGEDDKSLP